MTSNKINNLRFQKKTPRRNIKDTNWQRRAISFVKTTAVAGLPSSGAAVLTDVFKKTPRRNIKIRTGNEEVGLPSSGTAVLTDFFKEYPQKQIINNNVPKDRICFARRGFLGFCVARGHAQFKTSAPSDTSKSKVR